MEHINTKLPIYTKAEMFLEVASVIIGHDTIILSACLNHHKSQQRIRRRSEFEEFYICLWSICGYTKSETICNMRFDEIIKYLFKR